MSNLQDKKQSNRVGRPTVMTKEVVNKLEQVFAIDGSVEEACSYADISRQTFYEHLKVNPEFSDRIEELRQRPVLKARQTVVKALNDPNQAFRYLEKKRRKEFGNALELTGHLTIGTILDQIENGQTIGAQGVEDIQSLPNPEQRQPASEIQEEQSAGALQPE